MKKALLYVLLVPVILLAGCAKVQDTPIQENVPEEQSEQLPCNYVITATMPGDGTRVSYHEQETSGNMRVLHQKWQVGDHLYGCTDDMSNWFDLRVTAVEEGKAILTPVNSFPTSGTVHVFYLGRGEDDYPYHWNLPCDLEALQSYNLVRIWPAGAYSSYFEYNPAYPDLLNLPAVMTADADVSSFLDDNNVLNISTKLSFKNQTAIIGLGGITGLDPNEHIERIELTGIRTLASWGLVNGENGKEIRLSYEGLDEQTYTFDGRVYTVNLCDDLCTDEEGNLLFGDFPLLMAVFPGDSQDTENIVLRARVSYDEAYGESVYYECNLNKQANIILANKYYYITPKAMEAPDNPVVRVYYDEACEEYFSLKEAFDDISTEASESSYVSVELLSDCTADGPLTLGGDGVMQEVSVCLDEYSLTLNENYITVTGGQINLSFYGGTVVQPTGNPFLSVTGGEVWLDAGSVDCSSEETPLDAPVTVSGTGSVHVMSGYFDWTSGPIVSSTSSVQSRIEGGNFAIEPTLEGNVAAPDGYAPALSDDPDFPYVFFPEAAFEYVAHTADGVLKTFSVDPDGDSKAYIARNNVYLDGDGVWHFEGPNWTSAGQIPNSAGHTNLFAYNDIKDALTVTDDGYSYIGPLSVSGAAYKWMNTNEWSALLNHYDANYQVKNCYLKCKVSDGNTEWRNLLLFPDSYEWPTTVTAPSSDYVNKYDLPWGNAPVFTATQANALLDAGFVFLPAAYPVEVYKPEDEVYVIDHYDGYYWSSSNCCAYVFTDDKVGYLYEGNVYNQGYSLRVAIPAN